MTGWLQRVGQEEEGTLTAFVAVLAVALIFVAGLAYDGGQLIAAHNEAADVAQAAARTGAQHLDLTQFRPEGAGRARLDAPAAIAAATDYVAATGHRGRASMDGSRLSVTVVVDQPMVILPIGTRAVAATATAGPIGGIQEARP